VAKGRQPTHNVKIFDPNREGDTGRFVGVGWAGKGGSISIKLDCGIAVNTDTARLVIFPRDERQNEERQRGDDDRSSRRERSPGRDYS